MDRCTLTSLVLHSVQYCTGCCSKIAEAEAGVSVNEKKWLVMHVHVYCTGVTQGLLRATVTYFALTGLFRPKFRHVPAQTSISQVTSVTVLHSPWPPQPGHVTAVQSHPAQQNA
jgi:hypothetical protein